MRSKNVTYGYGGTHYLHLLKGDVYPKPGTYLWLVNDFCVTTRMKRTPHWGIAEEWPKSRDENKALVYATALDKAWIAREWKREKDEWVKQQDEDYAKGNFQT